jgi:hypothetical protein
MKIWLYKVIFFVLYGVKLGFHIKVRTKIEVVGEGVPRTIFERN